MAASTSDVVVVPASTPSRPRDTTTMDHMACIQHLVRDLKVDRDTWHAVALQYKAAFEAQTARLHELQNICVATQAELENARTQQHRRHASDSLGRPFGTATVYSPRAVNPLFNKVHESAGHGNYAIALAQVERLLRCPLSSKARAEGLLLKSTLLRASGPDDMLDALAACSEAVELCNRLTELQEFLPKIQYQQSLLFGELRGLHQTNGQDGLLLPQAAGNRHSCDNETDILRYANRRSGFDENRTMEGLLAHLEEKATDVRRAKLRLGGFLACAKHLQNKRRRTSARLRQHAAVNARQITVPYRWVKSKSEEHHRVS
jgi:hypothetical protein